jgi:hydrogenase maturation protease
VLILGCGNPDRSDDAAGLLVVRRLRELSVDALEHSGEALALIETWSGTPEVIVIDAVVSGAPPGTITVWAAFNLSLLPDQPRCSTHALGLAEAIELARVLDRLPTKLTLYGIEGVNFEHGGPLSPRVAEAVERLAQEIAGAWSKTCRSSK